MGFEKRQKRKPLGRKRLTTERAAYFRLLRQGYSNACRIVGINLATGRRWRHGRGRPGKQKGAPPVKMVELPPGSSRYLREASRIHIADRLRDRAPIRTIASELGRIPSTISREVRRNRH